MIDNSTIDEGWGFFMYLINQVSKLTGLTKKALRYYEEQGILFPSLRDKENGYRMYDECDLKKAQLINLMRQYDFSISEIKDTLSVAESEEDLTYIFKEKIELIERNIAKEQALIKEIKKQLEPISSQAMKQHYTITIEEIEPITVASIRVKDAYNKMGQYIPTLFKEVKGSANGNLLSCYYDEGCVEIADMELCLPIKEKVIGKNVICQTLPGVKAVCTTHHGSFETLCNAYKALFQYVNENNIKVMVPSREEYIKGPGMIFKGNPDKYMTRIILPFEMQK